MTERDDFAILPERRKSERRGPGIGMWVAIIVIAVIVAFAAGMAVATMMGRTEPPAPSPTPTAAGEAVVDPVAATAVAGITPTLPIATTALDVPTVAPTAASLTATLVVTAVTTTPEPVACTMPLHEAFLGFYDPAQQGCPSGEGFITWGAWEAFERGAMFWRSDTDRAYIFFDQGDWGQLDEGWEGQEIPSRGAPPPGLQAPIRGFGYAWATRDDLFNRLGWATAEEKGFCVLLQPVERGFLMQSSTIEFCQDTLYNHAREPNWQPLNLLVGDDGRWHTLP